ncbi:MAG: hypothetical protein QM640_00640 [Niabella sp.]
MKKIFWLPVATVMITVVFTACLKSDDTTSCTNNTLAQDQHIIDSFAAVSGLELTWDSDNYLYYQVMDPGTGSTPTSDSLVAFTWVGTTMSGTQFTSYTASTATYSLSYYDNSLLTYALTKLQEGGSIKIIFPSSVSYGCSATTVNNVTIPGNSQIVYDISLTDVANP